MFPLPIALNPVLVPADADAVHANVVPATLLAMFNVAVPPEQNACVNTALLTSGTAFTVTSKLLGVPGHDDAGGPVGVTT